MANKDRQVSVLAAVCHFLLDTVNKKNCFYFFSQDHQERMARWGHMVRRVYLVRQGKRETEDLPAKRGN